MWIDLPCHLDYEPKGSHHYRGDSNNATRSIAPLATLREE